MFHSVKRFEPGNYWKKRYINELHYYYEDDTKTINETAEKLAFFNRAMDIIARHAETD